MNTTPAAPAAVNPLLEALEASGLFSAGQVRQLAARYAAWASTATPEAAHRLAERLVASGFLTPYQAERLLDGATGFLCPGQYRILDRIAVGGMGQVFKAEHRLMQRLVAIKLLTPQGENSQARVAGFLAEIRAAARLCHPHVVTAFDANVEDGRLYLVMEYVPGIDLARVVAQEGPLPVVVACDYIRQAALGLQGAHEQGLVHRDVKPSNILVIGHHRPDCWPSPTPATVKLLDLGLACLGPMAEPHAHLAGTPDFMAPERGRDSAIIDIRSDLYSLGCTFYFLLTGQVPYAGSTWTAKLVAHQVEPVPSPAEICPEVPQPVVAIVQRLLAKEPQSRYQTPAELAAELAAWLEQHGPQQAQADAGRPALAPSSPTVENLADATSATRPTMTRRWGLMTLIPLAILVGVLLAISARWMPRRVPPGQDVGPVPRPVTAEHRHGLRIEGRAERYATLASAVAAARDGDVIEVPAGETIVTPPLSWTGKALTLRAAAPPRPRIVLASRYASEFWEALLTTDASLTLEGLELSHEPGVKATAHLVSSRGPRLTLKDCRLLAPDSTGVVVCRRGGEVMAEGCEVTAQATGLSLELPRGGTGRLRVADCRFSITDPTGAALSIWATGTTPGELVRVELERSRFEAGRVLGLSAIPGRVEVTARGNTFRVQQAVLSLAAWPVGEPWRKRVHWQDEGNTHDGPVRGLLIDGETVPFQSAEVQEK